MSPTNRFLLTFSLFFEDACAPPRVVDAEVIRPPPGAPFLEELPGPSLGPFTDYSSALLAACNKIIKKPNATAGKPRDQDFDSFWRAASEYCGWIYYTPDQKYILSRLTDQSETDPAHRLKSCALPYTVKDSRYSAENIKYIFAVHNHPWDSTLSDRDIRFIVSAGTLHGFEAHTKDGSLRLSIVAFFSRKSSEPACDGFHQYIPLTGQILKWSKEQGRWNCEQTRRVTWNEKGTDFITTPLKASCSEGSAP